MKAVKQEQVRKKYTETTWFVREKNIEGNQMLLTETQQQHTHVHTL